jgi:hypothetical protein
VVLTGDDLRIITDITPAPCYLLILFASLLELALNAITFKGIPSP